MTLKLFHLAPVALSLNTLDTASGQKDMAITSAAPTRAWWADGAL